MPASWKQSVQLVRIMSDAPHPTGAFQHAEPGVVQEHLGLTVGSFAVIRPDGYVALLGDAADAGCITSWLESIGSND